jgi:hypothetical protein
MQVAVEELIALGPLPSSAKPDVGRVKAIGDALSRVKEPVSDEEARALVRLFGPDDCFGLAWELVHKIETAPNWPLVDCLHDSNNEWITLLRQSAERGRQT